MRTRSGIWFPSSGADATNGRVTMLTRFSMTTPSSIENSSALNKTCLDNLLTEQQDNVTHKQNDYFAFILYSTFGLSFVRFVGCLFYFFKRNLFRFLSVLIKISNHLAFILPSSFEHRLG